MKPSRRHPLNPQNVQPPNPPRQTRREMLRTMAELSAAATLAGCSTHRGATPTARTEEPNRVRAENAKPGSLDWLLQKTAIDPKTKYRCPWIEGYCSQTTLRPGGNVTFHL